MPLVDWLITFALLAGLTTVARCRRRLRALDRGAYRHFSAGLVLMTIATLLRIYSSAGLLDLIPFLAEPLFNQLLTWVFVITGMTLIISGLAGWLPIARRLQVNDQERLARLEIFRHIEQLASIEPRVEPFMQAVLRHLVRDLGFSGGLVFTCTASGDRVRILDQQGLPHSVDTLTLRRGGSSGVRIVDSLSMCNLPDAVGAPSFVLPVSVAGAVRAAFVLYSDDDRAISHEAALDLRLAADIISRRIADSTRVLQLEHHEHRNRIYRHMVSRFANSTDLGALLTTLVRDIRPLVPIDLASLHLLADDRATMDRVTIGRHDKQLVERSVNRPEYLSRVRALCSPDRPEIFSLAGNLAELTLHDLPGDSRSVAVMAFPESGVVRTLVLLSGPRPGAFSVTDLQTIEYFLPILAARSALDTARRVESDAPSDFLRRRQMVRFHQSRPGIRSSLSGILGSVELLRTGAPRSTEATDRYLEIIDRSARKISDIISGDTVALTPGPAERDTHATR